MNQQQVFSPAAYDIKPTDREFLPWSPNISLESVIRTTNEFVYENNYKIILNDIFKSHLDWMDLGVGEEGSGKTRRAIRDILKIDANFSKQPKDLPQVIYSLEELKLFITETWRTDSFYGRRGVGLLFDEGNLLLSSKRTLSKENVEIEQILTQVRSEFGFYMVVNFQSFRQPQSYIRNDRVKSLCRTHLTFNKKEMRHKIGSPYYYNRHLIKEIKKLPDGRIVWPKRPSFTMPLPETLPPLYEAIEEKKAEFLAKNDEMKQGKRLNERRKNKLLLDLQLAKIDGNSEKYLEIKKKLEKM